MCFAFLPFMYYNIRVCVCIYVFAFVNVLWCSINNSITQAMSSTLHYHTSFILLNNSIKSFILLYLMSLFTCDNKL